MSSPLHFPSSSARGSVPPSGRLGQRAAQNSFGARASQLSSDAGLGNGNGEQPLFFPGYATTHLGDLGNSTDRCEPPRVDPANLRHDDHDEVTSIPPSPFPRHPSHDELCHSTMPPSQARTDSGTRPEVPTTRAGHVRRPRLSAPTTT